MKTKMEKDIKKEARKRLWGRSRTAVDARPTKGIQS